MKIFDFIFSFIPLLMIILFLTRFILKVRKNNGGRPKPLNIIEPVGKTDSDAVKGQGLSGSCRRNLCSQNLPNTGRRRKASMPWKRTIQ